MNKLFVMTLYEEYDVNEDRRYEGTRVMGIAKSRDDAEAYMKAYMNKIGATYDHGTIYTKDVDEVYSYDIVEVPIID